MPWSPLQVSAQLSAQGLPPLSLGRGSVRLQSMHSMEPPTTPPVGDAAAVGGAAWTPAADCAPGALGYLRSTHALHIRVPTFFSSWFFENEVRGSVCSQATQGVVILSGALLCGLNSAWTSAKIASASQKLRR